MRRRALIITLMALLGGAIVVFAPTIYERARPITREAAPDKTAQKIVDGALAQLGTKYTTGYFQIDYPSGDLPSDQGVCTDVVVRALRAAGHDLQKQMHEDMKRNFAKYPKRYGLSKPDPNIDHRRVPNQITFMKRFATELTIETDDPDEWLPGDIVYWKMSASMDHCGIVSNRRNARGLPYVIHNGGPCREDDALDNWEIVGHFRFPKRPLPSR